MKSVIVEKRTAATMPYRGPNQRSASVVAEAEAAERKRFCPIRITASSREVWERRIRIIAPRRSPRSRMAWRSMRPSETRAVSDPAKKPDIRSDSPKART